MVSWLSLLLGTSIGAGANAYLTLLAVGLYARFGEASPEVQEAIAPFGSYWVIVPAGALFLVEFFADKVPALDNLWDALHTLIRPVAAIFIALTLARDMEGAYQLMAAMGAGTIALGAHGLKAGLRGLARLNPEPASNAISSSGLSLAEDVSVAALIALVFAAPGVALVVIGAILVVIAVVVPRLARLFVFAVRAAGERLLAPFLASGRPSSGKAPPPVVASIRGEGEGGRSPEAIAAWCRCYLDRRGFFDFRPAVLLVSPDRLTIVHKQWFRPRRKVLEVGAMRGVVLSRGPLAYRVVIDTAEGESRLLLLSSERRSMDVLREWLKTHGVPVATGRAARVSSLTVAATEKGSSNSRSVA